MTPDALGFTAAGFVAGGAGGHGRLWLGCLVVLALLAGRAGAETASQPIYLQCLTNFEAYAETVWHASATIPDAGYWGDGISTGNAGIRGNSGVAVAYATLCVALPDDPKYAIRLARVRQALNYDHYTHTTGAYNTTSGNRWGWNGASGDWQTPEWAGSMGLACLLVQSNLPAATVAGVRRVIVSEADHRASLAPASGYLADTKAEENAWQGNILALAAAWMSTSNNAPTWLAAAKKYLVNTYTRADTGGDPLAGWITTVTLFPDYALENHGFYHPTYEMVAGMSAGDSLLMARLAEAGIAAELQPFAEHNVMAVWTNNMSRMVTDTGDFAYPAGIDWELHDYEQCSFITWLATHFNDPVARWTDERLAWLTRYRQQMNGDGEFVGPSGGGFYREAVEARRVAICWLHGNGADYPTGAAAEPAPASLSLPDTGIITARGTNGFVSLSYGPQTNGAAARILATIEPLLGAFPGDTFVTTPLLPGIIGMGAMGAPTGARLVSLATNLGGGFQAELQLTNGANGTTEVYFNATGDTVGIVEVPWPASGVANAAVNSFAIGIENDPLTGGARLLEWRNGAVTVASRSGLVRNVTNDWICVAGRYGVGFGPAGYLNYTATTTYNRLGAAQDVLGFVPTNSLAPRYAVWFPGRTALQTSNLMRQVAWSVSGPTATLTFPGPGGNPVTVVAGVPVAPVYPAYPAYELGVGKVSASSYQSASYPPTNAVDNNSATFWVSLYGPTNHVEWLKVDFARPVAISGFQIVPRQVNNGYGPATCQLVGNVTTAMAASGQPTSGTTIWAGTGYALATLAVTFPVPVQVTNVVLVITGAFDNGATGNPRTVQLAELNFLERAEPGTFADWELARFTAGQLTNPVVGAATADPDGDGVPNLLEFATGGNPLVADATNAAGLQPGLSAGQFAFQFQERRALGNVGRQFQSSADLVNWSNRVPAQLKLIASTDSNVLYQAVFPWQPTGQFFRRWYGVTN